MRTLNELNLGERAIIKNLHTSGPERRRLQDLGLVEGTAVTAVLRSPSGDPVAYDIRGAIIAIRKEDAQKVVLTGGSKWV